MDGTEENEPQKSVKTTKKKKDTTADKEFVKNTIEINPDITEQKKGSVVISFGRLNPITVGHEKMVDKLKSVARSEGAKPLLFLSHSQDKKKNPLSYNDKYDLARKAFGSIVQKSKSKTIMQVMQELQTNYSDVTVVVGSDRVKEFDALLQKYNGKDYQFDSIKVVSAGERDPDADDVTGMSASKMRALAVSGKEQDFKKGLPSKLQGIADQIYDMVRAGMQLAEELEAEGLLSEAPLSLAQRRKRARVMKRYASKIATARRRKSRRKATKDVLQKRAKRKAIETIKKKVSGRSGKLYKDLSPAEKIAVDKKVQNRQRQIERLAKKLMPKIRKTESERLAGRKMNEEFEMMLEDYYKGVPLDKRDARKAHFERGAEMDDNNPAAYKPAPGDEDVETKQSKHTKKFRQMYGEEMQEATIRDTKPRKRFHELLKKDGQVKFDKRFKFNRKVAEQTSPEIDRLKDQHKAEKNRLRSDHERELDRAKVRAVRSKVSRQNKMNEQIELERDQDLLNLVDEIYESIQLDESKVKTALQKKADKTGISYGILKKVYDRGVAAWRTGHRPGTTPSQWGMARVNSFATKSKGTWGKADSDLAAKVRNEEVEVDHFFNINEQFELLEASIVDKALAAIHKHVMGGTELSDIAFQVSRARGVNKSSRELTKAYIEKYGDPKKKTVGSGTTLRKKYGFTAQEEHGAGEWGTNKLANRYRKDTPGQVITKED